jgi:hypothetical protein
MSDHLTSNERLNVSDQSTADPMIKLRRFLIDLSTQEASSYFHADGFPRQALSRDAAEFVKALDSNAKERAGDLDRMERAAATIEGLNAIAEAMSDCIGVKEGQTFEDRAEELVVTEVQHMHCTAEPPTVVHSEAVDYMQRYFFDVHGLKYSRAYARIVLETAMRQASTKNSLPPSVIPPFRHWTKDCAVPYDGCTCATCTEARTPVETSAVCCCGVYCQDIGGGRCRYLPKREDPSYDR